MAAEFLACIPADAWLVLAFGVTVFLALVGVGLLMKLGDLTIE